MPGIPFHSASGGDCGSNGLPVISGMADPSGRLVSSGATPVASPETCVPGSPACAANAAAVTAVSFTCWSGLVTVWQARMKRIMGITVRHAVLLGWDDYSSTIAVISQHRSASVQHPWPHTTTIYQIYPRSFFDTNGDGIGDLQGIIQKLDHIKDLGFETIWISPFFASPQADFGYDISDYTDIAPEYGTMRDALQLIEEVHQRGMRIIFDMVMNHTSSEHPWFKEARSSRDNPKADWYIWRDQPNNWHSLTGESGWHYSKERRQYYWASFLPFQPDLNYQNPEVKRAMFNIIRFWLEKGVDGFRLDIFNALYKDAEFRDNPFTLKFFQKENDYSSFFQQAKYNVNQPESFEFARELRNVCDQFGERLLLGEAVVQRNVLRKFLGGEQNNGLGLMFDFEMLNFKFNAHWFRALVKAIEADFPEPFMPVYVFSNHDRRRSMTRLGGDVRKAKLLAMLQLTLRGVPCMYYGEEIGMRDLPQPFASALDPLPHKFKFVPRIVPELLGLTINRDEVRTPMQWDGTRNAGFSSAHKTWLPVHKNYGDVNVQKEDAENDSLLNAIRSLLKIRAREKSLREGALELLNGLPNNVLGYVRKFENKNVMILLNFDERGKEFQIESTECIFKLSGKEKIKEKAIWLNGFGGVVIRK
jgi:alpha-glucosidase